MMFGNKSLHNLFSMVLIFGLAGLTIRPEWGWAQASALECPTAAIGTAFTYHGVLYEGGTPATGTYDFSFLLYDAASGGAQVGSSVTHDDVSVTDGQFTLLLDFGDVFDGTALWLEIGVRPGASEDSFTTLAPRQALTLTPFAGHALHVPWGGLYNVPADLLDGDDDTTYTAGIGLDLSGTTFSLTNTYQLPQTCACGQIAEWNGPAWVCATTDNAFWSLSGNSGTNPTVNYLGTSDAVTLTLAVSGTAALQVIPTTGTPNLIGGFGGNSVAPGVEGAVIAGGGAPGNENQANSNYATVSGGFNNTASGDWATVGGGYYNTASGPGSVIAGGGGNFYSTIYTNTASGIVSVVGGGAKNAAIADTATVSGGNNNTASGVGATIGGGARNTASGKNAVVAGGGFNQASGDWSVVGGGEYNIASGDDATVGGGDTNTAGGYNATIGGGGGNTAVYTSTTVSGGEGNTASGYVATVGGGSGNAASGWFATISGGSINTASGRGAVVAGGNSNQASGDWSVISGGEFNTASGNKTTIGGGSTNTASGWGATIGGGESNTASGHAAVVPGGSFNNAAGDNSFAAGRRAKANNQGCFVWGDATDVDINCNANNRTIFRATGGFYIYTNSGLSSGMYMAGGGSSWNAVSNRDLKENFAPVDRQALLQNIAAIEVSTWNYKSQDPRIRHIGPMAQDFNLLIAGLGGEGELYINSLDADGIALAAIQGLYEQNLALQAQNQALEHRVNNLENGGMEALRLSWWIVAMGALLLLSLGFNIGTFVTRKKAGRG